MKKRKTTPLLRLILGFASLALTLTACSSESTNSESESYPKLAGKWSSPSIPVCWESSSDGYGEEKEWVREKVEEQFEGLTVIDFTGWGNCTQSSTSGIRIGIDSGNPHTAGLGRNLNGLKNGMMFNFTFATWSTSCQEHKRSCIESIGVHEFGHGIGLAHEQNRLDTPKTCKADQQGSNGDVQVGEWDQFSVMNYCNPVYNGGGKLSKGDIAGVARLYGERSQN